MKKGLLIGLAVTVCGIGLVGCGEKADNKTSDVKAEAVSQTKTTTFFPTTTAITEPTTPAPTTTSQAPEPTTTTKGKTMSQTNAMISARRYLDVLAFSRDGLIRQLVQFDKFSEEDATYAADNIYENWNDQAYKCAKNYLNVLSFSHDGLVEQMVNFDLFTYEQAEYGVSKTGL